MRHFKPLEFKEMMAKYEAHFGQVPDGVLRSAANTGLTDKLASDLEDALAADTPITDWGPYVQELYIIYKREKRAASTQTG